MQTEVDNLESIEMYSTNENKTKISRRISGLILNLGD